MIDPKQIAFSIAAVEISLEKKTIVAPSNQ